MSTQALPALGLPSAKTDTLSSPSVSPEASESSNRAQHGDSFEKTFEQARKPRGERSETEHLSKERAGKEGRRDGGPQASADPAREANTPMHTKSGNIRQVAGENEAVERIDPLSTETGDVSILTPVDILANNTDIDVFSQGGHLKPLSPISDESRMAFLNRPFFASDSEALNAPEFVPATKTPALISGHDKNVALAASSGNLVAHVASESALARPPIGLSLDNVNAPSPLIGALKKPVGAEGSELNLGGRSKTVPASVGLQAATSTLESGLNIDLKTSNQSVLPEATQVSKAGAQTVVDGSVKEIALLDGQVRFSKLLSQSSSDSMLEFSPDTLVADTEGSGDFESVLKTQNNLTALQNSDRQFQVSAFNGKISMQTNVAVGQPQWPSAIAERAAWLVSQTIQSAEIQLDPPELGPLNVKIHLQNDQAAVSFTASSSQVKEALDQSLVRLRELLQEQGLQLVDAGVSDQNNQQQSEHSDGTSASDSEQGSGSEIEPDGLELQVQFESGIDTYI